MLFLSLDRFRNGNVQLHTWVSYDILSKGSESCFPDKSNSIHFLLTTLSPRIDCFFVCLFFSDKCKSFILHYKYFPSVLLSRWFVFPSLNSLRMGIKEVVGETIWRGELCFLCLKLVKILNSLKFSPLALFFKSYSSLQLSAKPFQIFHFLSYVWILYFYFCRINLITFC